MQRRKFFRDPWNIFEFFVFLGDWLVTSLYIAQAVLTNLTMLDFRENKREYWCYPSHDGASINPELFSGRYVNFQQVTVIDSIVGNVLAVLAFLGILRFLKLLRFNKKIGMLTSVLRLSAKQWPGFFVLAAVFFIAFIHIG